MAPSRSSSKQTIQERPLAQPESSYVAFDQFDFAARPPKALLASRPMVSSYSSSVNDEKEAKKAAQRASRPKPKSPKFKLVDQTPSRYSPPGGYPESRPRSPVLIPKPDSKSKNTNKTRFHLYFRDGMAIKPNSEGEVAPVVGAKGNLSSRSSNMHEHHGEKSLSDITLRRSISGGEGSNQHANETTKRKRMNKMVSLKMLSPRWCMNQQKSQDPSDSNDVSNEVQISDVNRPVKKTKLEMCRFRNNTSNHDDTTMRRSVAAH